MKNLSYPKIEKKQKATETNQQLRQNHESFSTLTKKTTGPNVPHFVPWVSLDLGELELCVIWIHTLDFLTSWSP